MPGDVSRSLPPSEPGAFGVARGLLGSAIRPFAEASRNYNDVRPEPLPASGLWAPTLAFGERFGSRNKEASRSSREASLSEGGGVVNRLFSNRSPIVILRSLPDRFYCSEV